MKRILFLLCLAASLLFICSCGSDSGSKEAERSSEANQQVFEAAYWIDESKSGSKTVTSFSQLSDPREKAYQYDGFRLSVRFSAGVDGDLEEAMKESLSLSVLEEDAQIEQKLKDTELGAGKLPAKQQTYIWEVTGASSVEPQKPGETGHATLTAFKTDMGIYTLKGICRSDDAYENMKQEYEKLLDSVHLTDKEDPEVFAANTGQAAGYVFSLQSWSTRTEMKNQVLYTSENMEALTVYEMKPQKLDEPLMEQTIRELLSPGISKDMDADIQIVRKKKIDSAIGTAIQTDVRLTMAPQESREVYKENMSAVFLQDKKGNADSCFFAPYDEHVSYTAILNSLTDEKEIEAKVNGLWENRLQYVGDNSAVGRLLQETDFKECGPYTIELDTKKEPYGLAVCYTEPVKNFKKLDFDSEAIYLLGLIENLDYVEIRSGKDTQKYTCDDANAFLKYNVKKLAKDKARLLRYALTRIHYNQTSLKPYELLKQVSD